MSHSRKQYAPVTPTVAVPTAGESARVFGVPAG